MQHLKTFTNLNRQLIMFVLLLKFFTACVIAVIPVCPNSLKRRVKLFLKLLGHTGISFIRSLYCLHLLLSVHIVLHIIYLRCNNHIPFYKICYKYCNECIAIIQFSVYYTSVISFNRVFPFKIEQWMLICFGSHPTQLNFIDPLLPP